MRFSAEAAPLPPLPAAGINYADGIATFGEMLNDQLNDCTCASYYHARQVWSKQVDGAPTTDPDSDVLALYEAVSGYNPNGPFDGTGANTTDVGAAEADVLNYLLTQGAPVSDATQPIDKIVAYLQVDQRNLDDLRYVIWECGAAFIGFPFPSSWVGGYPYNIPVWDGNPADPPSPTEGHAVILVGWNSSGFQAVSWGGLYTVTPSFISQYVDESFAVIDPAWLKKNPTGATPLGLSEPQLSQMMQGLTPSSGPTGGKAFAGPPTPQDHAAASVVIQNAAVVNIYCQAQGSLK